MNRCPYCGQIRYSDSSRQLFIGFGSFGGWGSPWGGWHQHWGHPGWGWGWGHHGWGGHHER
jgi:hypothetical protein